MFDSTDPPSWWTDLNPEQQQAVAHEGPALAIVAGAGTGKTGTLAARVGRLLDDGATPERILLLTFTRRAAAEMIGRAGAIGGRAAASQVVGGTFHAVANRTLRHHAAAADLDPSFTVLDPADATGLFALVRDEAGVAGRGRRFPRAETVAAIWSRMVNSQSRLAEVLEEAFPWCLDHREALAEIFAAYVTRKRRHRVLDFDDLLLHWRALLASPRIGERVAAEFDHVLVDEYQDTNAIQADIVLAHREAGAQITVVGDDAQAIYGFRAASVANLWELRDRSDASVVTLEQNYRSTQPILDVANAVIARSPELTPKVLHATRPGIGRPELRICTDEAAQSAVVCERVLELREQGVELRDQAVLFRTGHHSDHLELELARRDIPFVKFGGLAFLEAAHIKDLMALLRVLDNPHDALAWHRVLRMCEGVGPASTARMSDAMGVAQENPGRTEGDPLAALLGGTVAFPSRASDDGARLVAALAAAAGPGDDQPPPAEQIERLAVFCGPVFRRSYDHPEARLGDLSQMASVARRFSTRGRLLSELVLDPPARTGDLAREPALDDDYLILSTIHSAKGGEWRSVHLIHAADGNIPSDMALRDADGLEEERRLLYVALTRAKEHLSITAPLRFHHRPEGDAHNLAPLSRFLDECRDLFDEPTESAPADGDGSVILDRVGLADEVDAAVHALFA